MKNVPNVFTVQMGLLACWKKCMYEGLFIAMQQDFRNTPGCTAGMELLFVPVYSGPIHTSAVALF